jgi:asparagine synthase (glutamine-hydrolysing)
MCGIAGQLSLDPHRPADGALVRRMTSAMVHRGPDGSGHLVRGPVALGHRRLAIIDLDTGAQPLSNEDGTVWVTFNGEIYNFRELRASLQARGHVFRTDSDTEVIVHLYEDYGEDCVTHLKGMFAFAVWDERGRRLFLARDRVGIKPLYYARTATSLLFASEIKALLEDPALPRRFDPRAIDRFLTYYYLPGEGTLFEGIQRLAPGHSLTVADGRVTVRQYWDIDFAATAYSGNFDDAVHSLRGLLDRTVAGHLMSDVPVGVLLSGGVDSTGMLRYAADHCSTPVRTFTIGFAGQRFADERPYARLAAQHFGAEHHEMTLDAAQFSELLPLYAWHMEEPVCEPPAIALYAVSQLARQQSVKVLLSGEGGDEAFGGYNKYAYLLALETAKSLLGPARGP